ncbi:hypothetical protein BGW39_003602, partial [Mortierella sp. 14UC]
RMRLFFVGAEIAAAKQTVTTLAFAGDEAVSWWTLLALPNETPFATFSFLLATEFSPAKFKEHILTLAMQMKMSSPYTTASVNAYINLARKYHLLLTSYYDDDSMLSDTIRTAFLAGCPLHLRQMLEVVLVNAGNTTIELSKLFKSAEEFGRIFGTSNGNTTAARALAIAGSTTDPHAMEIDHMQFNNINSGNYNPNSSYNGNNNSTYRRMNFPNNVVDQGSHFNHIGNHPPRLTEAERQYLDNNNGCYRCRQTGHFGRDCPIYGNNNNTNNRGRRNNNGNNGNNGNNNRNNNNNNNNSNNNNNNNRRPPGSGTWVYQVAVGNSPEQGKASDAQA